MDCSPSCSGVAGPVGGTTGRWPIPTHGNRLPQHREAILPLAAIGSVVRPIECYRLPEAHAFFHIKTQYRCQARTGPVSRSDYYLWCSHISESQHVHAAFRVSQSRSDQWPTADSVLPGKPISIAH